MQTSALKLDQIGLEIADGATKRQLLDDINLEVAGGEVVGIAGPSGSGKSTLLAIAGALQQPSAGTVHLTTRAGDGVTLASAQRPVGSRQSAALRREHLGIVFQQPNLLPSLTAIEQLLVMKRLGRVLPPSGQQRRRDRARAAELLERVGLGELGDRKIATLSGGQQARVNLARALMNEPSLLLVDEPTAALDTHAAQKVTQLIRELAHQDGIPTLYVSHDRQQLAELDRVVTIVDGRQAA